MGVAGMTFLQGPESPRKTITYTGANLREKVRVNDLERAVAFYTGTLGLEPHRLEGFRGVRFQSPTRG